jgi:hypothetical protein
MEAPQAAGSGVVQRIDREQRQVEGRSGANSWLPSLGVTPKLRLRSTSLDPMARRAVVAQPGPHHQPDRTHLLVDPVQVGPVAAPDELAEQVARDLAAYSTPSRSRRRTPLPDGAGPLPISGHGTRS